MAQCGGTSDRTTRGVDAIGLFCGSGHRYLERTSTTVRSPWSSAFTTRTHRFISRRNGKDDFRPSQFSVPPISERDRQEQPALFASLSADDMRGIQAAYFTSLSFMDSQVGRLIDALDQTGLFKQHAGGIPRR